MATQTAVVVGVGPGLGSALVRTFAKEGYGMYRANTAFAEKVAATYGPVKRDVEKRLKKALDPNNIIAPGRCGISL